MPKDLAKLVGHTRSSIGWQWWWRQLAGLLMGYHRSVNKYHTHTCRHRSPSKYMSSVNTSHKFHSFHMCLSMCAFCAYPTQRTHHQWLWVLLCEILRQCLLSQAQNLCCCLSPSHPGPSPQIWTMDGVSKWICCSSTHLVFTILAVHTQSSQLKHTGLAGCLSYVMSCNLSEHAKLFPMSCTHTPF